MQQSTSVTVDDFAQASPSAVRVPLGVITASVPVFKSKFDIEVDASETTKNTVLPTEESGDASSTPKDYIALPATATSVSNASASATILAADSSAVISSPTAPPAPSKELIEAQEAYEKVTKEVATFGIFSRFCPWLLRIVDKAWKLYFVGVIFGLGFDTATEVALLAMSATSAVDGLPVGTIMCLPILFTAGMCLIGMSPVAVTFPSHFAC